MKKFITLLQILFVCVFIACGAYVAKFFYDKSQTEEEMKYLQSLVDEPATPTPAPTSVAQESVTPDTPPATPEPEQREENGMLSRYQKLYAVNSDMIGWVKIDGTKIDYPVVQNTENNTYYLRRNFEREESYSGVPYLDYQCDAKNFSDNLIVYAHNMKNGTMFHDLLDYEERSFWKNHPTIAFDTMYYRCEYEVFAAFHTKVGSSNEFKYYDFINADSRESYDNYINQCVKLSEYSTGITPQYGEILLTLSTCSYNTSNERFVVVARQISRR